MNYKRKKSKFTKQALWIAESIWLALQTLWLKYFPKKTYVKNINDAINKSISRPVRTLNFLKALAKNPKGTGAVLPSSKYLAYEMVSHIRQSNEYFVVELGPGTGVITEAILSAGVNPKQIIAIEYAPSLAKQLRKRFPDIEVIEGDAADLKKLLNKKSLQVDTILSGLPLRSLEEKAVQSILSEIASILLPGGRYIQFTYDIRSDSSYHPESFTLEQSRIIWKNIPPAKVDVFKK